MDVIKKNDVPEEVTLEEYFMLTESWKYFTTLGIQIRCWKWSKPTKDYDNLSHVLTLYNVLDIEKASTIQNT